MPTYTDFGLDAPLSTLTVKVQNFIDAWSKFVPDDILLVDEVSQADRAACRALQKETHAISASLVQAILGWFQREFERLPVIYRDMDRIKKMDEKNVLGGITDSLVNMQQLVDDNHWQVGRFSKHPIQRLVEDMHNIIHTAKVHGSHNAQGLDLALAREVLEDVEEGYELCHSVYEVLAWLQELRVHDDDHISSFVHDMDNNVRCNAYRRTYTPVFVNTCFRAGHLDRYFRAGHGFLQQVLGLARQQYESLTHDKVRHCFLAFTLCLE